jgi:hypothetical protein
LKFNYPKIRHPDGRQAKRAQSSAREQAGGTLCFVLVEKSKLYHYLKQSAVSMKP